uniref:Solute carrier family 6 member 18 n=1 Tax=Oryctolagus cuniculus TaxID=9986 RepID=G1U649_RABIT
MAQDLGPDPALDAWEDERPQWDNKLQYMLSCVGFAVGLGNIWRCQNHSGGAFFIPYFIALVFEGIPLFHIELAIGQHLHKGSIGVWTAISPLPGQRLGCLTMSFLVSLYYNTILTWVLWYFLNSFQHPLPWSHCLLEGNRMGFVAECQGSSTVSYFWYRQMLDITADISDSGTVQWRLLICLVICWAVVYLCIIRGIETTGKAIYFTALFSYLVLTIFLVRGLMLPGVTHRLCYLFTPNVSGGATQVLSRSLAFSGHIAFASYNPSRNNCEKDTMVISLVNSMTSLYASVAIFSVMGFKATTDHGQCLGSCFSLFQGSHSQGLCRLWVRGCWAGVPTPGVSADTGKGVLGWGSHSGGCAHTGGAGLGTWGIRMRLALPALAALGPSLHGCVRPCIIQDTNMEGIITLLLDMGAIPTGSPRRPSQVTTCFMLQSRSYWLEIFNSYAASFNLIVLTFFEVVGSSTSTACSGELRSSSPPGRRNSTLAGCKPSACSCPCCLLCGSQALHWPGWWPSAGGSSRMSGWTGA